jgi:thiosulfate/3-mercaptopyruvate sulfurtransferase
MKAIQFWFFSLFLVSASTMFAATMFAATMFAAENEVASEGTPGPSILVGADLLRDKLGDKDLRVIDVRSQAEYDKGHVPGAVRVDVGQWKDLAVAEDGLRDEKGWAEKLGPLGLQKEMHVVVYGSKLSDTARIWWSLKYVGIKNASILNGGWEWWTKTEGPIETSTAHISATPFHPDFQADRLAEIDSLKLSLKSVSIQVVDTRSDDEFNGGRVPGAAHLEWKELVADDGRFKSKSQLQKLFHERGIVPSVTAVCY